MLKEDKERFDAIVSKRRRRRKRYEADDVASIVLKFLEKTSQLYRIYGIEIKMLEWDYWRDDVFYYYLENIDSSHKKEINEWMGADLLEQLNSIEKPELMKFLKEYWYALQRWGYALDVSYSDSKPREFYFKFRY